MSQVNTMIVKGAMTAPLAVETLEISQMYMHMKLKVTIDQSAWLMVIVTSPDHVIRAQALVMNGEKELILSDDPQTSSFSTIPGCIPSGEWSIQLMNGSAEKELSYTIEAECGNEILPGLYTNPIQSFATSKQKADFTLDEWDPSNVLNNEERWYRGDFHTHTYLSDGKLSPEEGLASAKKMGLDFFVATDHNIIPTKWINDGILIIPGIEVTSSKGHFNALGSRAG
ncbi:PHP domain-containing protein [Bacillus sp. JCM 19034]|uniref:PHP domain-containing protein n=1 Tax=Bacillus sp. JCM 19034 TaxID=1481928 RepID=UPI0007807260|nr:PHP domain-containing protein [Bacillus sp. JCM 19034]